MLAVSEFAEVEDEFTVCSISMLPPAVEETLSLQIEDEKEEDVEEAEDEAEVEDPELLLSLVTVIEGEEMPFFEGVVSRCLPPLTSSSTVKLLLLLSAFP